MPNRRIDEDEIKRIATKYIHSVRRNPETTPKIQEVIKEALKNAAPERDVDEKDIPSVIAKLKGKHVINDKVINEAAKDVVDHAAMEDLKHLVGHHAERIGKGRIGTPEVEQIIKKQKLNPYKSSLPDIRKGVEDYFRTGRPLEYVSPAELQGMIRDIMKKVSNNPVNDSDVQAVMGKYVEQADQDHPVNTAELEKLVRSHLIFKHPLMQPGGKPRGPTTSVSSKAGDDGKPKYSRPGVKQGGQVPPKDPKHLTFFEKIRIKLYRYGMKSLTKGARNWMEDEVFSLKRVNRKNLLQEGDTVATAMIGKMFMYFYDAKTKKDLPYWDKFPLVFPIEIYKDGWLGLNLHYLPIPLRMRLFDKLLQFANDKSLDKITKLRLSYGLLKSIARYPEVRPCIKRYLSTHVRSSLLRVEPINWEIALFLPVEQFQKERKETVWKKSREKIRNLQKFRRK
jgi:hypothetical protein